MRLKHLILAHHGTHEFGSPRLPMTPEEVAACYDDLEGPDTDDGTAGSAAMGDRTRGLRHLS